MSASTDQCLIVLLGGGVESTMLVKQLVASGRRIVPVHVNCGFIWEACESDYIRRFLLANANALLLPLEEIRYSHVDVMEDYWAITGKGVPKKGDSSKAIELPMRNLTLLTVAAKRLSHFPELHLVMGTTADNSYSDGTRSFFDDTEKRLALDVRRPARIMTPLIHLHKPEVIRQTDRGTLSLSFSCMNPRNALHCGECYKCGRRQAAFEEAGVEDPTIYAHTGPN